MRLVELAQPDQLLDAVYEEVLAPSFPPAELCSVDGMRSGIPDVTSVTALLDEAGRPVAAAVGDWSERSRIQLLSYLAVLPEHRGRGHGSRLLEHVLGRWREQYHPCAILAEIEDPAAHEASDAYGDPAARLRFYARHGATALDLPYFQPALREGSGRYYDMFLICLYADRDVAGDAPNAFAGRPLRDFMREYLEITEGTIFDDDPPTVALFDAIDRPGGVPLRPLAAPVTG